VEWDGKDRRRDRDDPIEDMSREVRALHETFLEAHRENRLASEKRQAEFTQALTAIVTSLHALELSVALGDSQLHERIAVHEASPHHAGTREALSNHENRLNGLDEAIVRVNVRLGTDSGRREAETDRRDVKLARWGIAAVVVVGIWQVGAQLVGSLGQVIATVWASLVGRGGPP
jgi:hypothetical protein